MADRENSLSRMGELWDRWIAKHGEDGRKRALGTLKGQVAGLRKARERKIGWANEILPKIEQARKELYDWGNERPAGATKMVKWLNERHIHTSTGGRFHDGSFDEQLRVDRIIAADAVMECRAQMSAKALSADFQMERTNIDPLEFECLERIKEGIGLARRLQSLPEIAGERLNREAFSLAAEQADEQRTRYFPMLARECYLRDAEFDEAVPGIERLEKQAGA